jgi:AraC-like DNA-binding protein
MPENSQISAEAIPGSDTTRVKPWQRSGIQVDRAQGKRGRKPYSESGAAEIRTKLSAWKQTPEPQRISLRALARELGTSHQLLSFYLKQWDKWQAKEYRRKANDIRARAEAQNRDLSQWEESQVAAYRRASFRCLLDSALNDVLPRWLKELREEAKRGKLSKGQLRVAKILASSGYHKEIREILASSG